jgi:TRAP-type C4-dicarboxylate transport system permease small subunit
VTGTQLQLLPYNILSAVASVAIALLGIVTCVDVAGRFFLGQPLYGALEILDMLTCLAIFPALPLTCRRRLHISVDLIDHALSPFSRAVLLRVVDVICALCLAVVAWRMFTYGAKIHQYGDTTLLLQLPLYPSAYLIGVMAVISAVACLHAAVAGGGQTDQQ